MVGNDTDYRLTHFLKIRNTMHIGASSEQKVKSLIFFSIHPMFSGVGSAEVNNRQIYDELEKKSIKTVSDIF